MIYMHSVQLPCPTPNILEKNFYVTSSIRIQAQLTAEIIKLIGRKKPSLLKNADVE